MDKTTQKFSMKKAPAMNVKVTKFGYKPKAKMLEVKSAKFYK